MSQRSQRGRHRLNGATGFRSGSDAPRSVTPLRHATCLPTLGPRARSWPSITGAFLAPNPDREHSVHGQRNDRYATHRGEPEDLARCIRTEMITPRVEPRMEERRRIARGQIDRRGSSSFPQRARDACERQVLERSPAADHARNDMVDVERRFLTDLRDPAILASIARS